MEDTGKEGAGKQSSIYGTKRIARHFVLLFCFFLLLGFGMARAYFVVTKFNSKPLVSVPTVQTKPQEMAEKSEPLVPTQTPAEPSVPKENPAPESVKSTIKKAPPKKPTPKTSSIVSDTTKNSDGSETAIVSTGGTIDQATLLEAAKITVGTASDIVFTDQTKEHSGLNSLLKSYIADTLLSKNEISAMKEIILRDAGNVGWCGLYNASYQISPTGQISQVSGVITLNAYSGCFYATPSMFDDYMKLYLSHEYGHHYTLYHKWIDWNLGGSDRFPESYYTVRPLDQSKTAVDYSLGWQNCDAEIIAEDYSYFYSGYGVQTMHDIYGLAYPSLSTKTWIENESKGSESTPTAPTETPVEVVPPKDTEAPTVSVESPALNPYVLTGDILSLVARASDNQAIDKIELYFGDVLQKSYSTSLLNLDISFAGIPAGDYEIKLKASDKAGNTSDFYTLKITKN